MVGLRLIPFEFDSIEFEVASGLILALRFGFEVLFGFSKNKKIWVLSFVFGGRKYGFDFCV